MDRSSNALQKRLLQAARGIEEPLYWARHIPTPQTVKNDLSEILCSRLRTRWYLRELSEVDYCPMSKRCGCKYQVEGMQSIDQETAVDFSTKGWLAAPYYPRKDTP